MIQFFLKIYLVRVRDEYRWHVETCPVETRSFAQFLDNLHHYTLSVDNKINNVKLELLNI